MLSTLLALAVAVLGITATLAVPLELRGSRRKGPETREEQINYLRRFGHWRRPQSDSNSTEDEDFRRSLVAFQSFFGLRVRATGEFNDDTKKLMATQRCGVTDHNEDSGRRKRYAYVGRPWPMTALTYRINNYTPDLETSVIKSDIIQAFKFWSDVTPLTFTESKTDDAKINISFASRDHGDGDPFDGKYRVIAHATHYPRGYIHFDEDETWVHGDIPGKPLSAVKTPNKNSLPIPSGMPTTRIQPDADRSTTRIPPYADRSTTRIPPYAERSTTRIPPYADRSTTRIPPYADGSTTRIPPFPDRSTTLISPYADRYTTPITPYEETPEPIP